MRENQKIKHSNIVFVILLIIGLALIIARSTPPVRLVKNFLYFAAYPNAEAADQIFQSAGTFADNLKAMVYLRQENLFYKQKNQELTDKLRNYDVMSSQYETLSKLLNVPKIKRTKSVFARVSVREPHDWYQWFIIDRGSDDGLYNDLPVTMLRDKGEMCAVGRIVETHKSSAKVALITNSLSAVPVEIKGKNINCLAEGFNSNVLKITYIPVSADVKVGDEVVASPLSSVFSEGMSVGIISAVSNDVTSDFKTATADILFESATLYEAVILVPDEAAQ